MRQTNPNYRNSAVGAPAGQLPKQKLAGHSSFGNRILVLGISATSQLVVRGQKDNKVSDEIGGWKCKKLTKWFLQ